MERNISYPRAFFAIVFATFAIVSWYLGVSQTLSLCVSLATAITYAILVLACMASFATSVCASVTCITAELHYGGLGGNFALRVFRDNIVYSLGLSVVSIVIGGLSTLFARLVGYDVFLMSFLGFDNLLFVLWKPYLASYGVAALLGALMFLGRKYGKYKYKNNY